MIELARKLFFSEEKIQALEKLSAKKGKEIKDTAEKCKDNQWGRLNRKSPIFCLAVMLSMAKELKCTYDEYGIDEKIYYDTMSDLKIWGEKDGGKGIKNFGWLKNHLNFELFRIGRLQFQLYICNNKTLDYEKLPFNCGDKLIYVHIPEGEKLETEKCIASFKAAEEFFSAFFPEYRYSCFFCESWLLFDGNRNFMAPDSNIIKFMELFTHCYSVQDDQQAIERIFGKKKFLPKNYPEKTKLQKRAKEYMLSGKKMGKGIGFVKKL